MGQSIGEVLAFGVGVTLSPLAVIAVVVMVAAPGGHRHAAAFVAAWILSLAVVGTASCSPPTARMPATVAPLLPG